MSTNDVRNEEKPDGGTAAAGRIPSQRFLQTPFWASFKEAHGWKALFFTMDDRQSGKLYPAPPMSGSNDAAVGAHASDSTNGGNNDAAVGAHASDSTGDGDNNRLTVLVRSFSLKIKQASLAYIPMAPELREGESHEAFLSRLCELANTIREFLPPNTMFVRYDCPIDFEEIEARECYIRDSRAIAKRFSLPLHVSPVAVQPPDTTILDLQKSEDEMLAAMKSKWRYNIRLAAKKGVQVACYHGGEADFAEKFDEFYRLFELTSERDGVSFHDKGYYLDLIERSRRLNEGAAPLGKGLAGQADEQDGDAQAGHNTARLPSTPLVSLYLASHEGDYLAGIITLFCPREAVYLYGASGNIKRNLMAAYLLQWTAIRDAKAYGCPEYDFYGMPPTDDEGHPMHGLYLFKTGFGGRLVHRPGSFDVPLKPASYRLYIQAEKARAFFFRKIVKKLKGR